MPTLTHGALRTTVIATLGLGIVAGGVALALVGWGRSRLERELALLRESGAPAFPEELPPHPASTPDPREWLANFESLPWEEKFLFDEVPACAESAPSDDDANSWWSDLAYTLENPDGWRSLSPCQRDALARRVEHDAALLDKALALDEHAAIDWRAGFESPPAKLDVLLPRLPIEGELRLVRVLSEASVQSALDGREGARRLDLALRAVRLFDDAPFLMGFLAWNMALRACLSQGVVPVLQISLEEPELSAIESELAQLEPAARLRDALIGERAMGNRIYRAIRDGQAEFEPLARVAWPKRIVILGSLAHDQADYLEILRAAIGASTAPRWDAAWHEVESSTLERHYLAGSHKLVSALLVPRFEEIGDACADLDARLLLIRAAIRARRDGADEARRWLESQDDPFDGAPLRSRVDEDGTLAMWSIGADRADDGGAPPQTAERGSRVERDVVIRVRPR